MADITTVTGALTAMIPVVAGGLIGVLGGLAGTAYSDRLTLRRTARQERQRKIEELATASFDVEIWLKKQESHYLFGGEPENGKSPVATIDALVLLYFPELRPQANALSLAAMGYQTWMMDRAAERLGVDYDRPEQDLREVYQPVLLAREELQQAASTLMSALYHQSSAW